MITLKDIKKSINSKISAAFAGIDIQSTDVSEGFHRPSIFVEFDNMKKESFPEQIRRSLTVRIYYFPSDRSQHSIELLEVQERLEALFDLKLDVLNRKFNIQDVSTNIVDGVLNFYFDIAYEEGKEIDESNIEKMLTLELTKG
ncbi:hypothetical protein LC040_06055 [Bacillus tianshenii]|nr:hypothetical protein LC040_06055 [Bacillus tianshenii]